MSSIPPPTPTSPHAPDTPTTEFSGVTLVNPSNNGTSTSASLQFRRKLNHLSTPLAPLLSITAGTPHPFFPATILHYHLLTEDQLNELAHHYHQRTPSRWSLCYPLPVVGRWHVVGSSTASTIPTQQEATVGQGMPTLEDKRRRFGRFVGLRGCESPVADAEGEQAREREQLAMDLWVEAEMKRREERAWAEMVGRGQKGCW
ncbi:MAG: hypothetical protein Q9219_000285 [cf. Caloplaca sp. 3 TL-2023]